jgi:hypothetical protein
MTRRSFSVAASVMIAAGSLLAAGCHSGEKTKSEAPAAASATKVATINTNCPIGGHDFAAGSRTAKTSRTWKGKAIGFCCGDCSETFDSMTAADKDGVLKLAEANKSGH